MKGYYVGLANKEGPAGVALLAGPFATYAEADGMGPRVVEYVHEHHPNYNTHAFCVTEVEGAYLPTGQLNGPLWVKVTV